MKREGRGGGAPRGRGRRGGGGRGPSPPRRSAPSFDLQKDLIWSERERETKFSYTSIKNPHFQNGQQHKLIFKNCKKNSFSFKNKAT